MSATPNPIAAMMGQAQQSMNNPMASSVPQPQGVIDPTQHPVVAAIIKALSGGAGAYGWTSMPPQQRLEAQQMEQQKAEAMARLGMQQQQLGYEGQRVGFEGQRTAAEVEASKAAAKRSQVESEEMPKRTKIEQQRADQEHELRKQELDRQEKQFQAEYGVGGLKSKELEISQGQLGVAKRRAASEEQMDKIIKDRDDEEAKYHQGALRAQGLQTDRTALEDERKARYKAVDETLDKHFWFYDSKEDLLAAKQAKHAEIDKDVNARIAQAEKTAGTGAGAGGWSGWKPTTQPNQPQAATPKTADEWLAQKGVKPTQP